MTRQELETYLDEMETTLTGKFQSELAPSFVDDTMTICLEGEQMKLKQNIIDFLNSTHAYVNETFYPAAHGDEPALTLSFSII